MAGRVAIGAIMKSEAPYIVEWVAWHRLNGFELIIADNGGGDGQTELLARLDAAGLVKRVEARALRFKPQVPAYNHILRHAAKAGIDILGFIDADEFLEPVGAAEIEGAGARLVSDLMARAGKPALAFNWMCFGSSHLQEPTPEPVLERFTMCAEQHHDINDHIKSFLAVKPALALLETTPATKLHPHGAMFAAGDYSHDGGPMVLPGEFGRSATVSWRHARIRHYVIKTYPEFLRGKDARGRADTKPGDLSYKQNYFKCYDLNDVVAPLPPAWIARLKREIASVESAIAGVKAPDGMGRPPTLAQSMAWFWRTRPFNGSGRGEALDKGVRQAAQSLRVTYFGST